MRQRDEELRRIRELTETVEQAIFTDLYEEMYDLWMNQEIHSIQEARAKEIEQGITERLSYCYCMTYRLYLP